MVGFVGNLGDGKSKHFSVKHGLSTMDVQVSVYNNEAPYQDASVDVCRVGPDEVSIRFHGIPDVDQFRVTILPVENRPLLLDDKKRVASAQEILNLCREAKTKGDSRSFLIAHQEQTPPEVIQETKAFTVFNEEGFTTIVALPAGHAFTQKLNEFLVANQDEFNAPGNAVWLGVMNKEPVAGITY